MNPNNDSFSINSFQKIYKLTNREAAEICSCSLPTIQKWRSGEVKISGSAYSLLILLHSTAEGDVNKLRSFIKEVLNKDFSSDLPDFKEMGQNVDRVLDRLELMLQGKRQEKILLESENRYRSMVDGYPYPVCRWKPDTTITYANKPYSEIFSKKGESLVGKKWIDFVEEGKRSDLLFYINDMTRRGIGQVYSHESEGCDGQKIMHEWHDFPVIDQKGTVIEFHSVAKDLTIINDLRIKNERIESLINHLLYSGGTQAVLINRDLEVIENYLSGKDQPLLNKSLKTLLNEEEQLEITRLLKRLKTGIFIYKIQYQGSILNLRFSVLNKDKDNGFFVQFYRENIFESDAILNKNYNDSIDLRLKSLTNDEASKIIQEELIQVSLKIGAESGYVYFFNEDKTCATNKFDWIDPQISYPSDSDNLIAVNEYKWCFNRIMDGNWVCIEDCMNMTKKARSEQELFIKQGVGAIIAAPIKLNDALMGYVGFDQGKTARIWHDQERKIISDFCNFVTSFSDFCTEELVHS